MFYTHIAVLEKRVLYKLGRQDVLILVAIGIPDINSMYKPYINSTRSYFDCIIQSTPGLPSDVFGRAIIPALAV